MRKEIEIILAKGSLDSADVDKLAKLQQFMTQEEKVRLGFMAAPALVVEKPVIKPEPEIVSEPVKVKKTIRKKKVL